MGKRCCINTCMNHKIESKNISKFKVPKNDQLLSIWSSVLGMILDKKYYICEKHFKKEDIKEEHVLTDPTGNIIFRKKLEKKQLKHGAIPCSFSNEINQKSEPEYAISPKEEESMELGSLEEIKSIKEEPLSEPTPVNDGDGREIFTSFSSGGNKIQLPFRSWSYHVEKEQNIIVFQGNAQYSEKRTPWYKKQIVLHPDLKMDIFLLQKFHTSLTHLNSQADIEAAIDNINRINLCSGGPPTIQNENAHTRCAYKDMTNHWRHNQCILQVDSPGEICKFCISLEDTFRKHIDQNNRKYRKDHVYIIGI